MGLNATVMCNCFQDGKATPPPFPREWLEVDDGGYINLKKEHDSDDNWAKYDEWQHSCCQHEDMEFAGKRISNWSGYQQFYEALTSVGWEHFPVLKEHLPDTDDGLMSSTVSAKALVELDTFSGMGEIGIKTVLVDTASRELLYEHVASNDGIIILSGKHGINVGLSEFEFFAVDRTTGDSLFRAKRFRQFSKNGTMVSRDSDDIVWEDLDTGNVYESGIAIHGKRIPCEDGSWEGSDGRWRFDYPSEFHVEQQPRLVTDFDNIVRALIFVLDASVKTGNPVRWC